MPPVGFEPTISAGDRPQTYALDRAAIGTVICNYIRETNYVPRSYSAVATIYGTCDGISHDKRYVLLHYYYYYYYSYQTVFQETFFVFSVHIQ